MLIVDVATRFVTVSFEISEPRWHCRWLNKDSSKNRTTAWHPSRIS